MKKETKIEMTEIFMAKAGNDFSRCFHGTIKRETDENGNPIVRSKIKVNNGYILAEAEDQWVLGEKLDQLVIMILNKGLHDNKGTYYVCGEFENSLN